MYWMIRGICGKEKKKWNFTWEVNTSPKLMDMYLVPKVRAVAVGNRAKFPQKARKMPQIHTKNIGFPPYCVAASVNSSDIMTPHRISIVVWGHNRMNMTRVNHCGWFYSELPWRTTGQQDDPTWSFPKHWTLRRMTQEGPESGHHGWKFDHMPAKNISQ